MTRSLGMAASCEILKTEISMAAGMVEFGLPAVWQGWGYILDACECRI